MIVELNQSDTQVKTQEKELNKRGKYIFKLEEKVSKQSKKIHQY